MYATDSNAKAVGQLKTASPPDIPQMDRALSLQEEAINRLGSALHRVRELAGRLGTAPRVQPGNAKADTPMPAGHVHRVLALANSTHSLLADIEAELEQIETLV